MTITRTFSCTAALAIVLSASVALAEPAVSPFATQQVPERRRAWQPLQPEFPMTSWNPLRFAIAAQGQTTWPQTDSAKRLVGVRAPTSAGVVAQAEVLRPIDRVGVRVDLGWTTWSALNAQEATTTNERLTTNTVSLGLSVRYAIFPWLSPYARLAGGAGWDKLTLGDGSAALHDRDVYAQGSAGGGLMLRTPGLRVFQTASSPLLALMGQIEWGYSMAGGSDFSLQSSPAGSSAAAIPTSAVALGHVSRNAPYLRFMAGIAF